MPQGSELGPLSFSVYLNDLRNLGLEEMLYYWLNLQDLIALKIVYNLPIIFSTSISFLSSASFKLSSEPKNVKQEKSVKSKYTVL